MSDDLRETETAFTLEELNKPVLARGPLRPHVAGRESVVFSGGRPFSLPNIPPQQRVKKECPVASAQQQMQQNQM